MDGWLGLRGWHLLFIIEGLPAVLLGIAARFILRDRPHQANWLSSEQKQWLESTLESERNQQEHWTSNDVAAFEASPNLADGTHLRGRIVCRHYHQRLVSSTA